MPPARSSTLPFAEVRVTAAPCARLLTGSSPLRARCSERRPSTNPITRLSPVQPGFRSPLSSHSACLAQTAHRGRAQVTDGVDSRAEADLNGSAARNRLPTAGSLMGGQPPARTSDASPRGGCARQRQSHTVRPSKSAHQTLSRFSHPDAVSIAVENVRVPATKNVRVGSCFWRESSDRSEAALAGCWISPPAIGCVGGLRRGIRRIWRESEKSYGYPRIHAAL